MYENGQLKAENSKLREKLKTVCVGWKKTAREVSGECETGG